MTVTAVSDSEGVAVGVLVDDVALLVGLCSVATAVMVAVADSVAAGITLWLRTDGVNAGV